ncbi:DUF177 domain-containing protein [Sphingomonas sp. BIUV-7]|uniref:DUF177 domain-containing protein n=1 Tax=Sphingomonas natans TaxID=3063330 RepID=A0ABT8YEW7_9SPHN|nr:DUF177 domain-containing protein [Sphingomonas sp. BIUV-7]MDO6416323.1 DUF177 domain-containing protein [Sphingomonas sp. BIUV-7]
MAELIPEFSRPVRMDTLSDGARGIDVVAEPKERAALAGRFRLVSIERLEAQAMLTRVGETVAVTGRILANVVQSCAASGEDVPEKIDQRFELRFVPEADAGNDSADEEIELDESALDEVGYTGSAVDLGEAVAQTLALALNPYPRAPNAEEALKAAGVKAEGEVEKLGALAGLRDLLKK